AHVHQHGARAKTALAVAAPVVEPHLGPRVIDGRDARASQRAIRIGVQVKYTRFHCADPAAAGMRSDGADHLWRGPVAHVPGSRVPLVKTARRNVDPVQRLLRRQPHRAFADGVARVEDQFGPHQSDSNGPASTKAPPWYWAAGSAGFSGACASTLARNGSELSCGAKPRWAALLLSHQRSRFADMP